MFLRIVREDESDAFLFVDPEYERTRAVRRIRSAEQSIGVQIFVSFGDFVGMIEGSDPLGGMETRGGGFDLEDLPFLEANENITAPSGIGGVDPVESGATAILPLLVFVFLGKQFEGAFARVAEFQGTDAQAGFDYDLARSGGVLRGRGGAGDGWSCAGESQQENRWQNQGLNTFQRSRPAVVAARSLRWFTAAWSEP